MIQEKQAMGLARRWVDNRSFTEQRLRLSGAMRKEARRDQGIVFAADRRCNRGMISIFRRA